MNVPEERPFHLNSFTENKSSRYHHDEGAGEEVREVGGRRPLQKPSARFRSSKFVISEVEPVHGGLVRARLRERHREPLRRNQKHTPTKQLKLMSLMFRGRLCGDASDASDVSRESRADVDVNVDPAQIVCLCVSMRRVLARGVSRPSPVFLLVVQFSLSCFK